MTGIAQQQQLGGRFGLLWSAVEVVADQDARAMQHLEQAAAVAVVQVQWLSLTELQGLELMPF